MSLKNISEIDKSFSEVVRTKRKHRPDKSNFTSRIVAEACGMSAATFSRKEKCKAPWSLTDVVKVCSFLGIENIKIGDLK